MALKPWYRVVTPREDLREGKPLDAAEFAVHLDQVRDGRAPLTTKSPIGFLIVPTLRKTSRGCRLKSCVACQVRRPRPRRCSTWRRLSAAARRTR